jgi:hypothetical protein
MKTLTNEQKDALAKRMVDDWFIFQDALREKGKYPKEKFDAFFRSARRYAEATRKHRLIHKEVAVIFNGLVQQLELERKRVPGQVLYDADRLECLFFCGYDPHFEGEEPPGL